MLQVTQKHRVFIAVKAIDFRKGIDGIRAICQHKFQLDPMSGHYFIFRNRKATSIKLLAYDGQGFWLCNKRLSKGTFKHWPKKDASLLKLTAAQLQVLLYNGDPSTVNTPDDFRPLT